MTQIFANNATSTTTDNPLTSGATTTTLASGTGALFPSPIGGDYFAVTFTQATTETSWEIAWCTGRSGDVLTIVRGQEGTSAASWALGSKCEIRVTNAALFNLINNPIVAAGAPLEWNGAAIFP